MKKRIISMLLTVLMVMSLFSGLPLSAYAATTAGANTIEYTMAAGDYVLRICQKFGLNYYTCKDAIMILNNIYDGQWNKLAVGRTLILPASDNDAILIANGAKLTNINSGASATTLSTGTAATYTTGTATTGTSVATTTTFKSADGLAYYLVPYTMSAGENVSGVCNSLGVNFNIFSPFIKQVNGISDWTKVRAGQTLIIPTPVCPSVGTTCYGVMQHKVSGSDTAYGIASSNGVNYNANKTLLEVLNQTNNLASLTAGQWFYYPVPLTVSVPGTGNPGSTATTTTTTTVTDSNGTTTTTSTTTAKLYKLTSGMSASDGTMLFYVNSQAVTAAPAGAKVTIVTDAKSGKAIQSLTVKQSDGKADLHLTGDTFVMPSCDVRVDTEIKNGHDINIAANYSGKASASVNGVTVQAAVKNAAVVIKSNDPNYEISAVNAYYRRMISDSTKTALAVSSSNAFIMPDMDVDVEVTLKPVATYAFYVKGTDPKFDHGTFYLEVNGSPVTHAAKGAKVTVVTQADPGYEPSYLIVTKHGTSTGVNAFSNTFTMPGYDVDVEVGFAPKGNNILTMPSQFAMIYAFDKATYDSFTSPNLNDELDKAIKEAPTGDTVYLVAVDEDGYALSYSDYIFSDYEITRNSDGLRIKANKIGTSVVGNAYTFVMPKGGVIITPIITSRTKSDITSQFYVNGVAVPAGQYKDCSFSVTWNDKTSEFNESAQKVSQLKQIKEKIPAGEYVDLRYDSSDGIAFVRYEIEGAGLTSRELEELNNQANLHGYFQMPEKDITIKAYFETGKVGMGPAVITGVGTASYKVWDAAASTWKSVNACEPGDRVMVIVKAGNGFKFSDDKFADKLIVTRKDNGARLKLVSAGPTLDDTYAYYFENMPAGGVDVRVTFDPAPFTITMRCFDEAGNNLTGEGLWQIAINWEPGVVDNWTSWDGEGKPITKFDVAYEDYVTVAMTEAGWSKYDMVSFRIDGKEYTADQLNYFYNFQMIDERAKNLDIVAILRPRVPYSVAIHNLSAVYDYTKGSVEFLILKSGSGYSKEYESTISGGALIQSQYVKKACTGDKVAIAASVNDGKYVIKAKDIVINSYGGDEDRIVVKEETYTVDGKPQKFFVFTMPDSDVVVSVPFSGETYTMTIVVEDPDGNPVGGMINLTAGAQTFGDAAANASFGKIEYNTLITILRSALAISQNKVITKVDVKTAPNQNPVYYYDYSLGGKGGNGPAFYMPASNVTVYITVDDFQPVNYSTFQRKLDGGTLEFRSGPSLASPILAESDIDVGDEIYIFEIPAAGKAHLGKGDLKVTNNGTVYTVANWQTELADGTNVWKYKVPSGLTIFTAEWPDEGTHAGVENGIYVVDAAGGTISFYGDAARTVPTLTFKPGETIYFKVSPKEGYSVDKDTVDVVDESGKKIPVVFDGIDTDGVTYLFHINGTDLKKDTEGLYASAGFKTGDKKITFNVVTDKGADAKATLYLDDGRSATIEGKNKIYELPVDTIIAVVSATEGYEEIVLTADAGTINGNEYKVPAKDAELTITLKPAENPIKWTATGGTLVFTDADENEPNVVSAPVGHKIYIAATHDTGYKDLKKSNLSVTKISDDSVVAIEEKTISGVTYWCFDMPAGGVNVKAAFESDTAASVKFTVTGATAKLTMSLGSALVKNDGNAHEWLFPVGTVIKVESATEGYDKIEISATKATVKDNAVTIKEDGAEIHITLSSSSNLITLKNSSPVSATVQAFESKDVKAGKVIAKADTKARVYLLVEPLGGYVGPTSKAVLSDTDYEALKKIVKVTRKSDGTTVDLKKDATAADPLKEVALYFEMPAGGVDVVVNYERHNVTVTITLVDSTTDNTAPKTANVKVKDAISKLESTYVVKNGDKIPAYLGDVITASTTQSGYTASVTGPKGDSLKNRQYTVPDLSSSYTVTLTVTYLKGSYGFSGAEDTTNGYEDIDAVYEETAPYEEITEDAEYPEYPTYPSADENEDAAESVEEAAEYEEEAPETEATVAEAAQPEEEAQSEEPNA